MEQKLNELSEQLSALSVIDAANLIEILEKKWNVSAAPQMMAAAPAAGAGEAKEEKTEFDVILVNGGPNKINVIKEIRTIMGLALKEAKETSEGTNVVIKTAISKKDAEAIKKQLEAAGAEVKLV